MLLRFIVMLLLAALTSTPAFAVDCAETCGHGAKVFGRDGGRVELAAVGRLNGHDVDEQLDVPGAVAPDVDARGAVGGRTDVHAGNHLVGLVQGGVASGLDVLCHDLGDDGHVLDARFAGLDDDFAQDVFCVSV